MNSYRLVIRDAKGGGTGDQGTGWFIRPDLVVTAFHVVGKKGLRKWLHERDGETYWLTGLPGPREIQLFPGCFDPIADIALLECASVRAIDTSALAVVAKERDEWTADGFPGTNTEASGFTGKITADRDNSLELFIEQGTDVTWEGISGTAIFIGDKVVGVVTDEVPHTNTLKAASFKVVGKLISAFDTIKRETETLKRLGIASNGDVQDLREQLSSHVEVPKLFEILREHVGEGRAIRVVGGVWDHEKYIDARTTRLGNVYDVAFDSGALYALTDSGIYRIRADGAPELINGSIHSRGSLFIDWWETEKSLYVSSSMTHTVYKVCISDGQAQIIAGSGVEGFAGDGGPALQARFYEPTGVAVSGLKRVYIADTLNHRIRMVKLWDSDPPLVETIAGNGTAGYSGDHGPAHAAQLNRPTFLELGRRVDGSPDGAFLFISDTGNHCIRRLRLQDGEITTFVGTGQAGFSGDGFYSVNSAIDNPLGLVSTNQGLFFSDAGNNRIRLLEKTMITIAGSGQAEFSGDCRDARLAELSYPAGLCFDPKFGVLYVGDGSQVKAVADGHGLYRAGIYP
jgi:hypothetical protein